MRKHFKAARLVAALLTLSLFLPTVSFAQEECSGNPKYQVKKTTAGFYEVTDSKTNTLVGIFDSDPRKESESSPQPNTYPTLLYKYFPYGGISSPTVADFFGTGEKQVAVCTYNTWGEPEGSYLHLYTSQGNEMPGFPLPSADYDVSVYDYGQDGANDICYYSYGYGQSVVDPYGNTLPNWPQLGPCTSAIEDVNNDGIYEVFSAMALEQPQNLIRVYGFDEWGNILPGWPKEFNYESLVPNTELLHIAIGDLDNDGQKEIITGYGPGIVGDTKTLIYAIRPDGSNAPGFPVTFNLGRVYGSVVADIDHDGWNEIVFSTGSRMNVIAHDGQIKPGWPRPSVFINYEPECGGTRTCGGTVYSPAIADLNGDDLLEIISGTNNGKAGTGGKALIFVFNSDGSYYPGWPRLMETTEMSPGGRESIGDVDGDCVADLVCDIGFSSFEEDRLFAYHVDGTQIPNFPIYLSTTATSRCLLTDLNSDGYLDIGITCESIGSPWTSLEFFNLSPNPYNRSCIEWPMAHFDIRNTGRYRKLYQIDKSSLFTVDKLSIPADGESTMFLTATATTEGALPSNFDGDLSGQDVRFARNPINGTFTGPIIDHLDGSYSRYLVAPNSDDPLTTNLMCWINESKLNTIIPVTFLGRPVIGSFSPRVVKAGGSYTISILGRNIPADISSVSDSPKLQITGLTRLGDTALEVNVNVASDAVGFQSLRLFGYQRYSDSIPLIAYQPSDLLLLGEKPAITDAKMVWYGLDDPPGINFRLTRATTPTFSDAVVIYEGTDRSFTDATAPAPIFYYKIEPE